MIKILKASAGSGKTYTLSNSYIDMLLKSGERDAYRHILAVTFTNKATAEMKGRILKELAERAVTDERALRMVTDILHDYSAFAVSTIDKFFQQTLKAFSREIGQFADYQIQLDRDSVIRESVDRMLDALTADDKDVLDWLGEAIRERLENGKSTSVETILFDMGRKLKSQEFRNLCEEFAVDIRTAFSKERISRIRKKINDLIAEFNASLEAVGEKIPRGGRYIAPTSKKYYKEHPSLEELLSGRGWKIYNTAHEIRKSLFSLGLAGEFLAGFDRLLKEKNLMCLDESTAILKDIIDGSDAPFVYEKVGVRYEHFLLDEFQDTSNIQWDNFRPLLKESESRGKDCLIVGDVKQSIYRFRDSDWRLLSDKIPVQFHDVSVGTMENNWRSTRAVVDFNNAFFEFAAGCTGLGDLYSDVRQNKMSDESQTGQVRVTFCEEQSEAGKVLESVHDALEAGAHRSEIAVLVRGRDQGLRVASELIGNGVPVISDDSLDVKSSLIVRRTVSLLSCIDNPDDEVSAYLSHMLGVDLPSSYHSLVDLCEELLRKLQASDPLSFEGQTPFIEAFLDDVQNWTGVNGNSLRYYLKYFKDAKLNISSPEGADAVRIITIHKAKGLEFPYLIFPYAEEVDFYRFGDHWCHLDAYSGGMDASLDGIYPVTLSGRSEDTLFADSYRRERHLQLVDNINIFYVALTRAGKSLHVISRNPSKTFLASLKKIPDYKKFSDILYQFCGCVEEYVAGEPYDFRKMSRKAERTALKFEAPYTSVPLAGRLEPSEDALDFFSDEGVCGLAASARLNGIVLHSILSEIDKVEDLPAAVASRVSDGVMSISEGEETIAMLRERIAAHPLWFSGGGRNEVSILVPGGDERRPDRVVEAEDGTTVVIDYKFGEKKDSYMRQVGRYMSLYRAMGHKKVRGYVWYVPSDEAVEV